MATVVVDRKREREKVDTVSRVKETHRRTDRAREKRILERTERKEKEKRKKVKER